MKRAGFKPYIRLTVFAALAAAAVLLLWLLAGGLNLRTRSKQAEMLKDAVTKAATVCYAIEGRYPSNLQYIIDNYGVSVDSDAFIVSYEAYAENLMPDIRVIEKES